MILHVGVNVTEKHIKYAEDVDCLGAEIHHYRKVEVENYQDLFSRVTVLESNGYAVCIDTVDCLYETDEGTNWYI